MGCIHSAPKHGRGGSLGGRSRQGGPPRASDSEIRDRIECSPAAVTTAVGTTTLRYAYLSQRGYYPDGACMGRCVCAARHWVDWTIVVGTRLCRSVPACKCDMINRIIKTLAPTLPLPTPPNPTR
jgi:hypothetical protein